MPKPLLKRSENIHSESKLTLKNNQKKYSVIENRNKEILLRKKRSKKYMSVLQSLDAGGHTHNQKEVEKIIHTIQEEFPEVNLEGTLLGIVSKCYLGNPYEVHCLDFKGDIIEHYKKGQSLPNGLEKARGIAQFGNYAFVEVYETCCRAISANGDVAVINN